jgi:hypothetical protein
MGAVETDTRFVIDMHSLRVSISVLLLYGARSQIVCDKQKVRWKDDREKGE